MSKYYKLALITVSVLSLNACSFRTLSPEQCTNGNWHQIGYNDGVVGADEDYILNHQKSCGSEGVIPDFQQWKKGWKLGISEFCTGENIFERAKSGYPFKNFCENIGSVDLQKVHNAGNKIHKIKQEIYKDHRRLSEYKNELSDLEQLFDSGNIIDSQERRKVRERMKELYFKIPRFEDQIKENEHLINIDYNQFKYDKYQLSQKIERIYRYYQDDRRDDYYQYNKGNSRYEYDRKYDYYQKNKRDDRYQYERKDDYYQKNKRDDRYQYKRKDDYYQKNKRDDRYQYERKNDYYQKNKQNNRYEFNKKIDDKAYF